MGEDHMLRMAEQIGELNGTVKTMSENINRFVEVNQKMHDSHITCCTENKVAIGKINARHATYWKIIGSVGGLGAIIGAFFKSGGAQ